MNGLIGRNDTHKKSWRIYFFVLERSSLLFFFFAQLWRTRDIVEEFIYLDFGDIFFFGFDEIA